MKKLAFISGVLLILIFSASPGYSQIRHGRIKGSGHIVRTTQILPAFNRINAGTADNIVILTKGTAPYTVVTETDDNIINTIRTEVSNHTLNFSYSDINPTKLKFYITVPALTWLKAGGAAEIKGADTLSGQTPCQINASGAADIHLTLSYPEIRVNASGAANVILSGKTKKLYTDASGAADIKAGRLTADSVFAKATGAADIRVNAQKFLSKNVSTPANIRLVNPSGKTIQIKKAGEPAHVVIQSTPRGYHISSGDTTNVNLGSLHIEVIDGDTTKLSIGGHTLVVDDNGDVKWKRNKPVKFNGHWGGVDLGINGYFTPSFSTDYGKAYTFLNQRYEKSINVNLNLYEQNIAFNKAKTIGMITGVGFSFNDYRFSNPTYLSPDSNELRGFYMRNVNVRKSKLSLFYVSVPILFEFQTNNPRRSHRFFVNLGVIVNARLRTHTKIYFNEANKKYYLEDPATGNMLPGYYTTPNRDNRNIVKSVNSFNLQPFRFDATIRLGYGIVSLYATYALNKMFLKGQGPNLNQWSAGVSISGW
jgi:hypothetical protein